MAPPVYRFGQTPPPENGTMDPTSKNTISRPKNSTSFVPQELGLGAPKQDQGPIKKSTSPGPMNTSVHEHLLIERAESSSNDYKVSRSFTPELISEHAVRTYHRGPRALDAGKTRNIESLSGIRPGNGPGGGNHENTDAGRNMNEHLIERFGRGRAFQEQEASPYLRIRPVMNLNLSIRRYEKAADAPGDPAHWTGYPEIPSAREVWDEGRQEHGKTLAIGENIIVGPYQSKEDYLERHYSLLREDAVAPLRDVISEMQVYPHCTEKDSENDAYIYERVYITGVTFANSGIAARITFSLRRVGKQVKWEQSKRLRTGTLVALSPAKDTFTSVCRVAVVAARPLAALQQNPPEIDLFFGEPDEFEIDPQQEWIMVESRNGFFEGHRHTLRGLQMLAKEKFPFSEHIVDIKREIGAPEYVKQQPLRDLGQLFPSGGDDVHDIDILQELPNLPSVLDASQMVALQRILAKRLAIVQGPPGTGKTRVSVTALRLMLQNMEPENPPIIVAAHTNHALDQLLRHVSEFEPDFIRVGGMSTDTEIIKPRTLFEVKNAAKYSNITGGLRGPALATLKKLSREMTSILEPLAQGEGLLSSTLFKVYNIISDVQYQSLVKGSKEWYSAEETMTGDMALWLGDDRVQAERRVSPEDFGVEIEEIDLEFEQLKEIEAETKLIDEEDIESLKGTRLALKEPWTGRKAQGLSDQTISAELRKRDMWDIPSEHRGPVYRHLQQLLKNAIRDRFREKARRFAAVAQEAKIGRWEVDTNYLKQARIIGMTTTGLSKYRGLIQSLEPRVVLIEEAAETLEAFVSVACFDTLEHLILVGDHQQLRGHCNDQGLEGDPFYLDVSMFERLVRNHVEFSSLNRQRRMIPEIRRTLKPIYDDLHDHPSVLERLPVPGMSGVNTFFFSHKGKESSDNNMSKTNHEEADMIVNFYGYLVQNGMMAGEITVLTFYNGQRKLLLRKLREHPGLLGERFKVVTVDSYQGEENAIVLLSLVRCNEWMKIGFLETENRVCVALSRAQRGFYIFGDAQNLCKSSMLWWCVVQAMAKDPCRVGFHLPLSCKNHGNVTFVNDAQDFRDISGGCEIPCRVVLECGHTCALNCHPFSHDLVQCQSRCNRNLECGHACIKTCSATCESYCECSSKLLPNSNRAPINYASAAKESPQRKKLGPGSPAPRAFPGLLDFSGGDKVIQPNTLQSPQSFQAFASGGHIQSDTSLAESAARQASEDRRKRLDLDNSAALFDISNRPSLVEQTKEMKLVRTKTDGQGGSRGVWKGTYESPKPVRKKEELSLLDLED